MQLFSCTYTQLDGDELRGQCLAKLATGRAAHPPAYEKLTDVGDLRQPLLDPAGYFGPLNREQDLHTDRVQFTNQRMTLEEAKGHISTRLAPLLF